MSETQTTDETPRKPRKRKRTEADDLAFFDGQIDNVRGSGRADRAELHGSVDRDVWDYRICSDKRVQERIDAKEFITAEGVHCNMPGVTVMKRPRALAEARRDGREQRHVDILNAVTAPPDTHPGGVSGVRPDPDMIQTRTRGAARPS